MSKKEKVNWSEIRIKLLEIWLILFPKSNALVKEYKEPLLFRLRRKAINEKQAVYIVDFDLFIMNVRFDAKNINVLAYSTKEAECKAQKEVVRQISLRLKKVYKVKKPQ